MTVPLSSGLTSVMKVFEGITFDITQDLPDDQPDVVLLDQVEALPLEDGRLETYRCMREWSHLFLESS